MDIAIATAAALLPPLLLLAYFRWFDVYREPRRVILATFGLGMLTVIPIVVVAVPFHLFAQAMPSVYVFGFLAAFASAAIPEEFFKFLVVRYYSARHKEFNEPMDGMVYGAAASLGFATVENLLYVGMGGLGLALLRAFTAVPMHALLGAIMGYYVGQWKFAHYTKSGRYLLLALFVPMLLHGLYDLPLLTMVAMDKTHYQPSDLEAALLVGSLLIPLGVLITQFVVVLVVQLRLRARQHRDGAEVAGTVEEVAE